MKYAVGRIGHWNVIITDLTLEEAQDFVKGHEDVVEIREVIENVKKPNKKH